MKSLQPLYRDDTGRIRFRENAICRFLLDSHNTIGMNELAAMDFSNEDREQFAQLIGYTLSGFSELDYVSDEAYGAADKAAKLLPPAHAKGNHR